MSFAFVSASAPPFLRSAPPFAPETQLLCLCARSEVEGEREARLQALLAEPLDWAAVLTGAALHGVSGMLYHHLARHAASVPADALSCLHRRAQATQFYNMRVMTELVRIAALFRAEGIPLLTYKGPALASRYYGNVAFRRFGDVDLLVHRDNLGQAKALLLGEGYATVRSLSDEQEHMRHEAQLGYELHHEERGVLVELHWALLNRTLTFRLSSDDVWARSTTYQFGTSSVQVLDPDDLLLYLCAHGTKHHWSRLLWVSDVAQVLRADPDRDWGRLIQRARSIGSLRTLLLGVILAGRWLDVEVPPEVHRRIASDKTVERLVQEVETKWFGTEKGLFRPVEWSTFWFVFRTRQRLRDNVALLGHYAALAVTPTEHDYAFLSLPPSLRGLYYLIRPFRLLRDGGRALARLVDGTAKPTSHHAQ